MLRLTILAILSPTFISADPAKIEGANFRATANTWTVSVTLSHGDTGWDDYADGWRIEDAAGNILGERPLAHPHVNEQPFTRSTSGVTIPKDVETVFIRARTNTEGWAEDVTEVAIRPGG